MSKANPDVLQGTLDLLILKSLVRGPMHGYGITIHIQQVSGEVLRVEEGSLYPALHRIEQPAGSAPNGASPTTIAARNITG